MLNPRLRLAALAAASACALAAPFTTAVAQTVNETAAPATEPANRVTIRGQIEAARANDWDGMAGEISRWDVEEHPGRTLATRQEVNQELADARQYGLMSHGDVGDTDEVLKNREAYNERQREIFMRQFAQSQPAAEPQAMNESEGQLPSTTGPIAAASQ